MFDQKPLWQKPFWAAALAVSICIPSFAGAQSSTPMVVAAKDAQKTAPVRTGKPVDRTVKKLLSSYEKGTSFDQTFRTLVALGPSAVPGLISFARIEKHPDHQRWTAIRAVGRIGDPTSIAELKTFLTNPHPVMRMAAIRALGDLGAKEVTPDIVQLLDDDSAMLVRNEAVQFLGKVKAVESVPALEKVFSDERNFIKGKSLFIRRHVVISLGEMDSRAAAPLLIQALDDSDIMIPSLAVKSLRRITGLEFEATTVGMARKQWKGWWSKELERLPHSEAKADNI